MNYPYKTAILADFNPFLVNYYRGIQEHGWDVAEAFYDLVGFEGKNVTRPMFFDILKQLNRGVGLSLREQSVYFLFLNKFSFQGKMDYKNGKLCVSFMKEDYKLQYLINEPSFKLLYGKLQRATVLNQSFEKTIEEAPSGSLIYCDPPYVSWASMAGADYGSGFNGYHHSLLDLGGLSAKAKGSFLAISNFDTKECRRFYSGADDFKTYAFKTCLSMSETKTAQQELLALYNPNLPQKESYIDSLL